MAKPRAIPPNMQDVARLARVHQTTVSRALRNDPRLPEETRDRIQAIARSIGYTQHPFISALITLRRSRRPPRLPVTLAFVFEDGQLGETGREQLAGARAEAERLGYALETFAFHDEKLPVRRLDAILAARNITGLIVGPLPEMRTSLPFDWSRYSAVVIEYTLAQPALDRVVHDSYEGLRCIMQECRLRGLRRVGLALTTIGHERTRRLNAAAFWAEQKETKFFAPIPPLIVPAWDAERFRGWARRNRIQSVVTSNALLEPVRREIASLSRRGQRISLANVNTFPDSGDAGVIQDHRAIGKIAARLAIEKLIRNDRGLPALPCTTLIQGKWVGDLGFGI